MNFVAQVKEIQRTDELGKKAWWNYADEQGGGKRDPAKHDAEFLSNFIELYNTGSMEVGGGGMDAVPLLGTGGMDFVAQVKEIQRTSESGKRAWWNFADEQGGNMRDPAKHDADVLSNFIELYSTGSMEGAGGGTNAGSLADLFKEGQRSAPSFKAAWAAYANNSGLQKHDPTKHSKETLIGFLEHLGQQAMRGQTPGGKMGGGGKMDGNALMQAMLSLMGGNMGSNSANMNEPVAKKRKLGSTVANKDALVEKIKAFQRSDEENKQAWWAFVAEQPANKKRDPALHEPRVLQAFCSQWGI